MVLLQQFYVMKLESSLLDFKGNEIECNLATMRKNKWIVSLADSQALRTIRKIRYKRDPYAIRYDKDALNELKARKRFIYRHKYTDDTYRELKEINQQIDEMLFMPEYLILLIENKDHYRTIIQNGVKINGHKFVRLLCGAGHARNNTVVFIREDFEKEVKENLQNGWNSKVKITDNKYNAYFALSSTATYLINDDPVLTPKVILINDCVINMTKRVDWVERIEEFDDSLPINIQNQNKIVTCDKELEFNLFDGGGLIDISTARKWAEKLQLDYVPSVFILRNIFIKGCLFVVDFKKFAREVAHQNTIVDLYGKEQTVEDADIILTKSMFKLWNAYSSMEQYQKCCDKYQNYWGVSRVAPKDDDDYVTTNYQFVQVLNMQQSDVEELCHDTLSWLQGVAGMDRNTAMLFLMGELANGSNPTEIYHKISDNVVKALAINPQMFEDDYVRQKLISSINKKIKESYIGKLIVRGCFSTMIPDPYAMMEWAFQLPVIGLLQEHEHYSHYWNVRGADRAVGCRSPLTWRSEVNQLNFIRNQKTEEWYQYLNSGIIYNIWGCDCMLHADSDYDGDIVFTTDNSVFLRCKFQDESNNLPITYAKNTVSKHVIKEGNLYKADLKSFDTKIGQVTNYSTSFYDLLYKFKNDNTEYGQRCREEILNRLKLTRYAQGNEIDKAKGVKTDPYPAHWIKKQFIDPEEPEQVQDYKRFLNDICADRKPAFFKYRYYTSKNEDKNFNENFNLYAMSTFGKTLPEILSPGDQDETVADLYKNKSVLIDYGSPMNLVYHYMEDNLAYLRRQSEITKPDVPNLLKTNTEPLSDQDKIDFIKTLADRYFDEKAKFKKGVNKEYNNIDQYIAQLRDEALRFFQDREDLANYVVEVCYIQKYHMSKSFAWNVFGEFLLENLKKNTDFPITIPLKDPSGDIEYLYNKYRVFTVEEDKNVTNI